MDSQHLQSEEDGTMRMRKPRLPSSPGRGANPIGTNGRGVHNQRFSALHVALGFIVAVIAAYLFLSFLSFIRILTLFPVAICFFSLFQREYDAYQKLIPASLVGAVVAAQLPAFLASGAAVVSVVVFTLITDPTVKNGTAASRIASRTKGQRESGPTFVTALISILLVIIVLLVENYLIWVVSATFTAGQHVETAPPPLQDNGQLIMKHLLSSLSKREVVGLRRLWNTQWSLVACLASSFLVAEKHDTHRTLFSVASRAMITVAIARSVRTVSFLLTVLPSQVKGCYAQRFPSPPPDDLWEWIYVGLQPRSHGGCNDLIISGHATITSAFACVSTSLAQNHWFSVALWSMVLLDYSVEIYEGFHYSVDMWLGMVLVALLWRALAFIEGNLEKKRDVDTNMEVGNISSKSIVWYAPPAIVCYLQMTVLPEKTANFIIVAYVCSGLVVFFWFVWKEENEQKKQLAVHRGQHIFLCLLVLALRVYL